MKSFIKVVFLIAFYLVFSGQLQAAANTSQQDKDYFARLLYAVCSVGNCSRTLNPNIPQEANEIISNSVYIVSNIDYEKVEKYNAPLKNMGIEGALLIPTKWVEDAVCTYYGLSINKNPELQKAAEEQSKYGFYPVVVGDAGEAIFEIEKLEMLKNGVMRVSGTGIDDEPFRAYFGKSNCGGKPHWVLLREIDMKPYEENENFQSPLE